jgi:transposase
MRKGQPRRVDERNGTASVFMIFAPLEGRRDAIVTERRTAIDYAHALKRGVDVTITSSQTGGFTSAISPPLPRSGFVQSSTRRYQSGEVDYDGHISRRGDRHLRGLLCEAAAAILTRSSADSSLRTWGLALKQRLGFKRAAVAVARKLAVIMHAMLKTGTFFDRTAGMAA